MNKRLTFILSIFLLLSLNQINLINEHIRKRVEDINAGIKVYVKGERLLCEKLLVEFYSQVSFEPAWTNDKNRREFINLLAQAYDQGLRAEDYHYDLIVSLSEKTKDKDAEKLAELDMLMTDAYLLYVSHLLNGKVNPETLDSEWKAARKEGNPSQLLQWAISEKEIKRSIIDQEPVHPSYDGLKLALTRYKSIAEKGGWKIIPGGETLKTGMIDSIRVPLIIQRLMSIQDLEYVTDDLFTYTEVIASSVKDYQRRNGLEVDGNLGKMTTESMNIPVEKRIAQLIVNMERFRWISHELGDRYIMVNIADFQLRMYDKQTIVFQDKVIVGKPFRKTPVFTSQMTYIVLNPYWTVPPTILYEDVIPEAKKNTAYLSSKKIRVYMGNGSNRKEIDPDSVNWQEMSRVNFPYILRQDPGPLNALGIVKFMFPNSYNVYIHDTPTKELFNRTERIFSSGCIRLNHPMSLVQSLIPEYLDIDMEKIEQLIGKGKEHTILLTQPLNVHILYLTGWVEDDIVHFRKDIYDRDNDVLVALNESLVSS